MPLDYKELDKANARDHARISRRQKVMELALSMPQAHPKNMWRVYDQTNSKGRSFSEEHYTFLMGDPVFAMMDSMSKMSGGDVVQENRRIANNIMILMRDRKLGETYFKILEEIERGNKIDLRAYAPEIAPKMAPRRD